MYIECRKVNMLYNLYFYIDKCNVDRNVSGEHKTGMRLPFSLSLIYIFISLITNIYFPLAKAFSKPSGTDLWQVL